MLFLYRRVIFGDLKNESLLDIVDLNRREIMIFCPLIFLTLWMGIYPSSFLSFINVSAANLLIQATINLTNTSQLIIN